jgi:crotonobetainyl-CoA:carnitine CoA-transferase CaiB-like acyl-CoA transferase
VTRSGALNGLLVLEIATTTAASYCSLILADLGARVIRIEHGAAPAAGDSYSSAEARYLTLGRNKESFQVNLRSAEGRRTLSRLVTASDAVVCDLSMSERSDIGLSADEVSELNPSLIFLNLTPFGQSGPWIDRPASEAMLQALSGGMSMTGDPGGPPRRAWLPIAELCGGLWGTIAILAALRAREASISEGCDIDLSLLDGQVAMIPYFSAYYFLDGVVPGPQGSGGHSPTYGAFRCSDDRYVIIAVIDQAPWTRLCHALSSSSLLADPRFATPSDRHEHGQELRDIIERVFESLPVAEWEKRLQAADLAFARVNRLDEALDDPQVAHRSMRKHLPSGHEYVRTPITLPGLTGEGQAPPEIGEHTDALLESLGVGKEERSRLRAAGVI